MATARVCCSHLSAQGVAGYAQMASLVVSWTRMLDDVQATAEDRPQTEFEHDEAHFLRVCTGCLLPACRLTPTFHALESQQAVSRRHCLERPLALPVTCMWGPAAELPCICKAGRLWLISLPAVPAVATGHSCAFHMQELVKQKFEPEMFAGVFSRGGSGPPRWLDGLLQDRCGVCLYQGYGLFV